MADRPQYISCLELATLAWPAAVRPEELGPGRTSLLTRAYVPTLVGGVLYTGLAPGVTVQHIVSGNSTPLTVPPVTGGAIVVHVATGSGGAPTSTQSQIAAALAAQASAAALASAATGSALASAAAATPISGSGSLQVAGAAFDAHSVKVAVQTGGAPAVATWKAWTDGATLGDEVLTAASEQPILSSAADPLGLTEGADTGLRVLFVAGDVEPSFLSGEAWTFTTKPVAAVQAACIAGSGRYRDIVSGPLEEGGARYTGEITVDDPSEKRNVAIFARLQLAESRGVDPGSAAGKLYLDSAAAAELRVIEVAKKLRHPRITEEGTPRLAPAVYLGADRGGISAAHRSGCR